MKKLIFTALMLSAGAIGAQARTTLYVSPDGSDSGDGSQSSPFATVAKAVETVQPGGTILVHAGTYYITERIKIPSKETSEQSRIRLFAYGDGEVIIDGTNMNPATAAEFKMARCMYFPYWANYWHVKGITFQNAKDNGVKVEGSHNIFEHCVFRDNNDTGLQIGMFKDWTIEEFNEPVVVKWGGAATDVTVAGADALTVTKDAGSKTVTTPAETLDYYLTDGAVILSLDNIASASLYSLDGRTVSSTIASQVIPLHDTHGLHILRVTTADGRTRTAKVALP